MRSERKSVNALKLSLWSLLRTDGGKKRVVNSVQHDMPFQLREKDAGIKCVYVQLDKSTYIITSLSINFYNKIKIK